MLNKLWSNSMYDNSKIEKIDTEETQITKNMKQIKFELLVEDINKALTPDTTVGRFFTSAVNRMFKLNPLNLIFNSNNENLYVKIILEKATFPVSNWNDNTTIGSLTNIDMKINLTKNFIQEYRITQNRRDALVFTFWALLTISVDSTSYSENLSLVSDFLYLLRIDNETLIDIIQVIKVIFGDEDENFKFQTEEVPILFSEVLNLFR